MSPRERLAGGSDPYLRSLPLALGILFFIAFYLLPWIAPPAIATASFALPPLTLPLLVIISFALYFFNTSLPPTIRNESRPSPKHCPSPKRCPFPDRPLPESCAGIYIGKELPKHIPARTVSHKAISNILLANDFNPSEVVSSLEKACATARSAGVKIQGLLSLNVLNGNSDTGMTPLCLEASRVDLEKESGTELVLWLIQNMRPLTARLELRKGCLRRQGDVDIVWNVLKELLPARDTKPRPNNLT